MLTPGAKLRVSVVCPVFNTLPALLHQAARSVLDDPSGRVLELILCDDVSTDEGTRVALAELAAADGRVVVVRAAVNGGPARARNLGLARCRGEWTGFIDADDLWTADHLGAVDEVRALAPDAAWVAARHDILHGTGTRTPYSSLAAAHPGEELAPGVVRYAGLAAKRHLVGDYWLHLGGCLVRTDLAQQVKFDPGAVYSEDWLFFLRLSLLTDLFFLDRATYLLRRDHDSFTRSTRRLTAAAASGRQLALGSPELRVFRRELRWALISTWKGLAANNLLSGHRGRAAWFAWRALMMDPREAGAFLRLARLMPERDRAVLLSGLRAYSTAELIAPG